MPENREALPRLSVPEEVKASLRRRHRLMPLWYLGRLEATCTACDDRPGRNTVCPGCGKEGR